MNLSQKNYFEVFVALQRQLPRQLGKKLRVAVRPAGPDWRPLAVYYHGDTTWEFPVEENGLISDLAIAQLCIAV